MKTIIVVYTNKKELSQKEIRMSKKYSFNTENEVSVGDKIKTDVYNTELLVVRVLNKSYKYYNQNTGKLSNTYSSTAQNEIVTIVVYESRNENIIYGYKTVD